MAGLKYWVWLNECRGLTNRSRALLLDHFGSPEDVYYADEAEYALVEGLSKKQIELLADKSADGADKILGDCQRLGLRILTMQDADYPARLRGIFEPPCLLYVKGTLPAFDEEVAVAMVGTRSCTPYGTSSAEKIAYGLAKQGALVVSGAARGIDSAAHRGALRAGGVTVAVLGNGLDVVYPEENAGLYRDIAATGALLSEYPPGTAAEGWHFPIRNRIISGLALGVVVVEAAPRSGSLITARLALDQNRAVYAVPPPGWPFAFPADTTDASDAKKAADAAADCDGCARLLTEGACPALNAADILTDLLPQLRHLLDHVPAEQAAPPPLEPPLHPHTAAAPRSVSSRRNVPAYAPDSAEGRAVTLLQAHGPLHIDDLLSHLPDHNAGTLSALLLMLELSGAVRRLPGAVYEACPS